MRSRLAILVAVVALWAGTGWWGGGYGWQVQGADGPDAVHVWLCRGRLEVFVVPFGACGYLPSRGWHVTDAADVLHLAGDLGNFLVGEPQRLEIPLRARWRVGFSGGIRRAEVAVPLWLPIAAAGLWCAAPRLAKLGPGTCGSCGYPRIGLPIASVCPECGAAADRSRISRG